MPKQTSKYKADQPVLITNLVLAVGTVLVLQFMVHVCWMAQRLTYYGEKNAPKTVNAVIALILLSFVWVKGGRSYQRLVIVGLLGGLAMGYVVWLLGETGAGDFLRNGSGVWQ